MINEDAWITGAGDLAGFGPRERISGRLAWIARGVGPMTPGAMPGLVGQTVKFVDGDSRLVYRLIAWSESGGYYEAEWPD